MRRATLAVLCLLALVPACGRKSRPIAPELVEPETPGDLAAIATPEGVRLNWTRPKSYTSGRTMNDLGKFVIERAPGEGAAPQFTKVGELILQDRDRFKKDPRLSWIDASAVQGTRYLYRVTAVTTDRYKSLPAGPVAVRFGEAPAAKEPSAAEPSSKEPAQKEPAE